MKRSFYIAVLVFLFVTIFGITFFASNQSSRPDSMLVSTVSDNKFVGIIKEVNLGCASDGICSFLVDDKRVIVQQGGLPPLNITPEPMGSLLGMTIDSKYIGRKVEVYAAPLGQNRFTIYGDKNYYVKLMD